jgi:hypothetical protein
MGLTFSEVPDSWLDAVTGVNEMLGRSSWLLPYASIFVGGELCP